VPVISTGSATSSGRAVLCGAQSLSMAFGRDNSPNRMSWIEELYDYKNQLGVSAGAIFGMKKLQYNSEDFGTIVYSTAHSAAAKAITGR